eukprot:363885-Chlamydomonas_euryale.AAC.12
MLRQPANKPDRHTDSQTDRHTDRQTVRQTVRQTDRKIDRLTDRQTDRQTNSRQHPPLGPPRRGRAFPVDASGARGCAAPAARGCAPRETAVRRWQARSSALEGRAVAPPSQPWALDDPHQRQHGQLPQTRASKRCGGVEVRLLRPGRRRDRGRRHAVGGRCERPFPRPLPRSHVKVIRRMCDGVPRGVPSRRQRARWAPPCALARSGVVKVHRIELWVQSGRPSRRDGLITQGHRRDGRRRLRVRGCRLRRSRRLGGRRGFTTVLTCVVVAARAYRARCCSDAASSGPRLEDPARHQPRLERRRQIPLLFPGLRRLWRAPVARPLRPEAPARPLPAAPPPGSASAALSRMPSGASLSPRAARPQRRRLQAAAVGRRHQNAACQAAAAAAWLGPHADLALNGPAAWAATYPVAWAVACPAARVVACPAAWAVACPAARVVACPAARAVACPAAWAVACLAARPAARVVACPAAWVVACSAAWAVACPAAWAVAWPPVAALAGAACQVVQAADGVALHACKHMHHP